MPPGKAIQAYTDGSYYNNKGGYGAVIFIGKRLKKFSSPFCWVDTTHNRMELRAVLGVLRRCKPGYKIDIYSDSEYCVRCLGGYLDGKPLNLEANLDLWKLIFKQVRRHKSGRSRIKMIWIRGHAQNPFNEMADELARKSRESRDSKVCKKRES